MRLGIVSDLHCQPRALERALAKMGAIDRLICLGDVIAQASFCNETVAMLRGRQALTIIGNHEEAFFAGDGRSRESVDPELADWLASRPTRIDIELGGRRLCIVHSTPWPSNHSYIAAGHRDFHRFASAEADVLLYGHTHQPLVRKVEQTLVVNPGSLGEGRPAPHGFVRSFAVLDLAALEAEIVDLD
jgi:putative phosphoesterase